MARRRYLLRRTKQRRKEEGGIGLIVSFQTWCKQAADTGLSTCWKSIIKIMIYEGDTFAN